MPYNRHLIFLLLSTLVSGAGTGLTYLGIAWVIQQTFTSYGALALLNSLGFIAAIVILPTFSRWVDYYPKIRIAKWLYLLGGLIQLAFYIIHQAYGSTLWLLTAAGIFSSLIGILEPVNRVAIAKAITSEKDYFAVSRLIELSQQLMTFIAGLVGIFLIGQSHMASVLLFDAISFLVACWLMTFVSIPPENDTSIANHALSLDQPVSPPSLSRTFYLFGCLSLLPYICIMAERVIYPGLFNDLIHASPLQYSLYTLPYAIGAITAIVSLGLLNQLLSPIASLFLCILLYFFATASIACMPTLFVTYAAFFIFSLCHCTIRINRLELLMQIVPLACFGRVNGFFQRFTALMIVMLGGFSALLASTYSILTSWIMFCYVSFIAAVLFFIYYSPIQKMIGHSATSDNILDDNLETG